MAEGQSAFEITHHEQSLARAGFDLRKANGDKYKIVLPADEDDDLDDLTYDVPVSRLSRENNQRRLQ